MNHSWTVRMRRFVATCLLTLVYSVASWYAIFARFLSRRRKNYSGYVMLIGTFHNPNWVRAHLIPILHANDGKVLVVCDEPVEPLEGLRSVCPPNLMSKLLSRAVAKFIWAIIFGIRYRPDVVMGYHIFPGAVSALVVGRSINAVVGYQVTAGQLELEGGGWHSENVLLTMLNHASLAVEKSALRLVRQFDEVIVRGSRAKNYLFENGVANSIRTITGSVAIPDECTNYSDREYDIIFCRAADGVQTA